ncbi:hypothetical protein [Steroidobacter sp.]|uniref:hypothetical protein n=1 Tax=Steroidobacter sp. TaxID=1978227 RepID=UPI001A3F47ED|nr:hypothetical protein [Steroidobacter sp.]MBL8270091.1 hypothetical protein [Steroidobacter sp.]
MLSTSLEIANAEAAPLADWTPEQQIAQMLELCEAQIESATCESDLAVDSLVRVFSGLAETARSLKSKAAVFTPEQRAVLGDIDLKKQMETIERQMNDAVVAFQFYDKLSQRLGHVRYSLSTLATFVCDREQATQREQWRHLFTTLKRLYRTEEEKQLFQMMVEGASADEARDHIHQSTQTIRVGTSGDIELF